MREATKSRLDNIAGSGRGAPGAANIASDGDHEIVDAHSRVRLVILGGGSVGLSVANKLREHLSRRELAIIIIDPRPYAQYPPFLPEAAAGSIEPRDVIAPHRLALRGIDVLQGKAVHIDHENKTIVIDPEDGAAYAIYYDQLVVALGSVSRTLPIPGLAEAAIGFKNVEEGLAIRNRVLNRMDVAASVLDPAERARMLTFTFVGGGFAGVEAVAELEDMARYACKSYPTISPKDLNFVLVEGSDRILPEVSEDSGQYALDQMRRRGITVYLKTFLNSCVDGHVVLSNGKEFESDTIVWTAGIKSNPLLSEGSDLPVDKLGRVTVLPTLQVVDDDGNVVPDVWAAGDCAAVPDIVAGDGKFCPPNAQYAIREAKVMTRNIVRSIRGTGPMEEFAHKNIGVVASLGMNKGVAEFLDGKIKLHGWPAWMAHRAYHVYAMPTLNRKVHILAGWLQQALTGREVVSLGSVEDPRREFVNVAVPGAQPGVVVEQVAESAAATAVSGDTQ
ncbi:MAG: NAD(P)/FAD-dependent oxidoreductase [Promicromonosporaceae bacterium]|nr:NAD(P)/FAD-dependent oxidoreductase [Promicromonosporaceae bacterium]